MEPDNRSISHRLQRIEEQLEALLMEMGIEVPGCASYFIWQRLQGIEDKLDGLLEEVGIQVSGYTYSYIELPDPAPELIAVAGD